MDLDILISQFIGGFSVAMLLFLVASGLTLIFGVANVFNFAHGSFYLLGSYFAYSLMQVIPNFWLGLAAGAIGAGLVGMVLEVLFLRRLYGRPDEGAFQILLTYSFILVIDDAVKFIWGPEYKTIERPEILQEAFTWGNIEIPRYDVFIIVVGLLVALTAWLVLAKTRAGKTIRAASLDRSMVGLLGINVSSVMTLVFGAATAMGGLAGALAAPLRSVSPGAGVDVIIDSLIVVVIGGLGNFWGALIGALIIGEVNAFGILWLPQWASLLSFAIMVIVLIFKPQGLFTMKGVKK
jgi:branched-chain amino acid transport system permease protein